VPPLKTFISTFAILLTFVGYIPYLRDTLKGKTKPHVFSWFIWGFVTLIAFGLQVAGNAGVGAWVTLAAVIISFVVFGLGLRNGDKNIAKVDVLFLAAALIATGIWLVAKQPLISVVLISSIEMLGFAPTVRKSWNEPFSETLFTYQLNAFRHGLSIAALESYNVLTCLYPITWALANGLFAVMLVVRRKQLTNQR
jgi:hypothetical protein